MGSYDGYRLSYGSPFALGRPLTPVVKRLLIATVAAFLVQHVAGDWFTVVFGLVPGLAVPRLYLWQFATYMFLHAGVFHLLFNMLVLYMFGRDIEAALGSRRFTAFYLFCGIGAGLCSSIFYSSDTIIIGASGAIFGILVAFGMLFPERIVTLLVAFVLPVSMKAKHLVMIFIGIEILLIASNERGGVAYFAHLGGALCGYLYIRNLGNMPSWLRLVHFGSRRNRKLHGEEDDGASFRNQVDAILEKISRQGISSLTEGEKEILRRAKDRY